jgi:putative endonuclease
MGADGFIEEKLSSADRRWWLYLLACADGRTYAGVALDVQARFQMHVRGKGARFTRANPPIRILGAQPFATKSQALQAEHALKRLKRDEKLRWAALWPRM